MVAGWHQDPGGSDDGNEKNNGKNHAETNAAMTPRCTSYFNLQNGGLLWYSVGCASGFAGAH